MLFLIYSPRREDGRPGEPRNNAVWWYFEQVTATRERADADLGKPHCRIDGFGHLLEFAWTRMFCKKDDTRLRIIDDADLSVRRTINIQSLAGMLVVTFCVDRLHGRLYAIVDDDPRLHRHSRRRLVWAELWRYNGAP